MNDPHSIDIQKDIRDLLIGEAMLARQKAYCPYSHYAVGAALLTKDGTIIHGCNVENASFGAGICAERNALFAAVGQGHRHFMALALVSGPEEIPNDALQDDKLPYPAPCGICRQALREFVKPAVFPVIMAKSRENYRIMTLAQLLPESFGPDFMSGAL